MLFPASDIDGWTSWCPEVDAVSQGETAEHALGMLIDSIIVLSHHDLQASRWEANFPGRIFLETEVKVPKRVYHPFRRNDLAPQDDNWPLFKRCMDSVGIYSEFRWSTEVYTRDCRHRFPILVNGNMAIVCRGGILQTLVTFSKHGFCFDPA